VAPAFDWWSLGMMLLEKLAAGACFEGVDDRAFLIHAPAQGVPLAETINGLYKAEVIHRRGPWRWVDWFNNRRLLEPIGHVPPAEAEAAYYAALEEPAALAA
jgi:transposase InsO family protein